MSQDLPVAEGTPARKGALVFIFAACLMDIIAIGIIIPVLPKLVEEFVGGDLVSAAHYLGLFGTMWALMQFFASPVLGALSDRFGRRPILLISIFGLGLDYVLMALAPNLAWLFVGRLISGITSASFATAGAYIADVTPPENRAKNFGLIGAAFGIGFVIGPALGGVLGDIDPRLPFWVAAGLALVNGLYGLFVLPESLPKDRRSPFRWSKANPIGSLQLLRAYPGLLGLAATFFLYMLAQQVMQTTFVLYTGYRYDWTAASVGLYLGAIGVGSIIVQTLLVGRVVKRVKSRGALLIGLACGSIGFAIFATAPTGAFFYMGVPIFALSGLVQAGYQGLMSTRVSPREQGRLQGTNSVIMGLAGMMGPALFSASFAWSIGPGQALHMPGLAIYLASALVASALAMAAWSGRARPDAA